MMSEYLQHAMAQAHYQVLPDNEGSSGWIEGFQGVWANAGSLEECRNEIREVLEEWTILRLKMGHQAPVIDNIDLNTVRHVV